jgi:hypothetical protein
VRLGKGGMQGALARVERDAGAEAQRELAPERREVGDDDVADAAAAEPMRTPRPIRPARGRRPGRSVGARRD